MIIKVDGDTFIEYESNKATVFKVSDLQADIAVAEARLREIPDEPSDEELLTWARQNFPRFDYSVEKATLNKTIEDNTRRLNEWQSL